MADKSKEEGQDAAHKPPPATPGPRPEAVIHPTHEAMSWIRALANDWEDQRSHSEATK